jgi:putative PIN family toxin of toxin-antitoxin system
MKIVLDTNVLIAAFITRGACSVLFEHCAERHQLATSEFILGELREHLHGKFKFDESDVAQVINLLKTTLAIVVPADLGEPVCRDPDDDIVLGTAVAANADCIVTGDEDLLVLGEFRSMPILRPRDFSDFEIRER